MKYLHYSKRYFYFFLLLILSLSTKGLIAQKGLVNKGAKMSIGENARIIISGSDLQFVNESASGEDGSIDLDGYLILEGPFYNNATAGECFVNLNNIGSVFFIGNTEQIIGGTGNIRFENIRINNTANILLNRNVSVEKEINFIDGDLFLNGYTLYLEDDGSITGSLGSSMIIANSGGYLYKKFNAPGSFVFPIGDNTGTAEYTPVDFTLSSYASITNAYFGLSVSDQKYAENTSPSEFLTRYWDLQHTGITDPVYSVDFHYLINDINGTEADIFAARYYSTLREVFTRVDDFSNILYVNDIGSMGAYTGVDGIVPTVSISSEETDPTNSSPFPVNIDFSEEITGFELSDISITSGTVDNLQTADSTAFTAEVTPLSDDTISMEITDGKVKDIAGNDNATSNYFEIEYDGTNPDVTLVTSEESPTNSSFQITITFIEIVSGFSLSDIQVVNGSAGNLSEITSDREWTAIISPASDGSVSVSIQSDVASDAAGNPNNASNVLELEYDATSPEAIISSTEPDPTNSSVFQADIQFSEKVSGFASGDIDITNASVTGLSTTDSALFIADITPSNDATISVQVPATVAFDSAGNGNILSNEFTILFDATKPVVSSFNPGDNSTDVAVSSNLEIVFDEVVNIGSGNITIKKGIDDSSFEVIDVTSLQVEGGGTSNITIDPSSEFLSNADYYVLIDATCFTDLAGNAYDGISTSTGWNFTSADVNDPVILNLYPPDNSTGVLVDRNISIKFSEAVYAQSGNIVIKIEATGSTFETIDVTSGQVTGSGSDSVVVDPSLNFDGETGYYVLIDTTAFDDAENNSFAGISSSTRWNFTTEDIDNPVINSLSPADNETAVAINSNLTINFNENVNIGSGNITIKLGTDDTDFEIIDVSSGQISGGGTSSITIDPGIDFSSTTDYYVLIDAGTFQDLNGNNYEGISSTTEWNFTSADVIAPTVTLSTNQNDPTNQATFDVTVEFSEEVQNFATGDVSVSNGNCTNLSTSDNTTYTATITPASDGQVDIQIPAGVVEDLSGNNNEASTVLSIEFDGTSPDVTINSTFDDPANVEPIIITIEFTEEISGFDTTSIDKGNCSVSSLSTTDSIIFTAELTPVTDGLITATVPENSVNDLAGNYNTASDQFTINYDGTSPTVTLTSAESSPTNQSPFELSIDFSELVSGFEVADLQVTNGDASNLSTTDDMSYTANITAVVDGEVTVDLPSDVAYDMAGNGNDASTQFSIYYQGDATSVDVASTATSPTNNNLITVNIEFSAEVNGFSSTDINVVNAQVNSMTTSDSILFVADVELLSQGESTLQIPAGVAEDQAGGLNTQSNLFSIIYDSVLPEVILSSTEPDPTSNSTFTLDVHFSEAVSGLTLEDFTVTNTAIENLVQVDDSTFSASVLPAAVGEVSILLPGNSVFDAANNGNTESNTFTIYFDDEYPTVAISSTANSPTNASSIDVGIVFSEYVIGFDSAEIVLSNATIGSMNTTDSIDFNATITPQAEGEFTVDVPAGVAVDSSENENQAAAQYANVYDVTPPVVSLSSTVDDTTDQHPVSVSAVATEPIDGIVYADIQTSNCNVTDISSTDNQHYEIEIEPINNGSVVITISANSISDLAGNTNVSSSSFSFYFAGTVDIEDIQPEPVCQIYSVRNKVIVEINKKKVNIPDGTIHIYNSYGEPLINKQLDQNYRYEFDLYGSTNVYYVKVTLNGKTFTEKVVLFRD